MPPVVRAQLDYYAVLEIAPSADMAQVNAAFRRLAWRYHLDRNHAAGATLQFQNINEAHQVLVDPGPSYRVRRSVAPARWRAGSALADAGQTPLPSPVPPTPSPADRSAWIVAVLFVSSAWAVIFTAMTAAHSGGISYNYHASTPSLAVGSTPGCGFSMEIYPVTYVDEHGRVKTEWGTDVHNCHGGSTRIDVAQPAERARPARFANDPQVR